MSTHPPGSCDCHVHLFGPAVRYPFDPARVYTPGDADESALNALHARLGVSRVVIVQPSPYGTDNRRTLGALATLGPRARAVAVIDDDTDAADLDRLNAAGIRGVRVNVATHGLDDPIEVWRRIHTQAVRVTPLGWHVQVLTRTNVIAAIADRVATLPCPLVVDHFGLPDLEAGPSHPAFEALTRLAGAGHAVVKLSAMERLTGPGRLARLVPFIRRLAEAAPEALVWGSDWPHTGGGSGRGLSRDEIEPFQTIDDADAVQLLIGAVPDPGILRAILVDTPVRLYGFEEE